jgi:hypothetical protein
MNYRMPMSAQVVVDWFFSLYDIASEALILR